MQIVEIRRNAQSKDQQIRFKDQQIRDKDQQIHDKGQLLQHVQQEVLLTVIEHFNGLVLQLMLFAFV